MKAVGKYDSDRTNFYLFAVLVVVRYAATFTINTGSYHCLWTDNQRRTFYAKMFVGTSASLLT